MFLFFAFVSLGAVAVNGRFCNYFLIYFPNYWEGAALALVADSFYSLPGRSWTSGFGFFHLVVLAYFIRLVIC